MKKVLAISLVWCCLMVVTKAATFPDVATNHPHYAAIESLHNLGIINGYQDGTFGPENPVNRAQALKMILGSADVNIPQLGGGDFPDVPADAWFASFVKAAKNGGIVNGNADGTFTPDREVTKAEFIKMLLEAFDTDLGSHQNLDLGVSNDTVPGDWSLPYFSYAKMMGITNPNMQNKLEPGKKLNRGECAEIIYKMLVIERGGGTQKLLSIAESNLVDLLIDLNSGDIQAAIDHADSAIFYTDNALLIAPDNEIVKGANNIARGFRYLCLAYQAGLQEQYSELAGYVSEADLLADEAYGNSSSLAGLRDKIHQMGKVLTDQVK